MTLLLRLQRKSNDTDPQGVAWEHFHTLGNIPVFNERSSAAWRFRHGVLCAPRTAKFATPAADAESAHDDRTYLQRLVPSDRQSGAVDPRRRHPQRLARLSAWSAGGFHPKGVKCIPLAPPRWSACTCRRLHRSKAGRVRCRVRRCSILIFTVQTTPPAACPLHKCRCRPIGACPTQRPSKVLRTAAWQPTTDAAINAALAHRFVPAAAPEALMPCCPSSASCGEHWPPVRQARR